MKTIRVIIQFFFGLATILCVESAGAVTFTTDTTIDTGNATYDGQAIVVSNCTLTVNGTHSFASVEATNGGILTHQATTTNQTYSLQLAISGALTVDATSRIDVSALGYLPGYTLGNTTNGGAVYLAGGSYGGAGFSYVGGGAGNVVYGDYLNPDELGSGSGNYAPGDSGGGLVRITAASAQLNGQILANGGSSYNGGSGGGIYLNIGALSGTGMISANGGGASGNNGGGGGRVAIYYTSDTGFNLTNSVTALGGAGQSGAGSAGTVFLQQAGQLGELLINNGGTKNSATTPLGVATNTVFLVDNLVIVGTNTVAATASRAPIQANSVTVINGAVLTHQAATTNEAYSLQATITNDFILDATSKIDVSGLGYQPGYTQGNTTNHGATFTAGGSYGGEGFLCCGSTTDPVYGDYHNPDDLGSGSGTYGGVPGGGLVRITAGSAEIDGQILANGVNGYDGASGGGIYLNVGALTGGGTINANGGSGDGNDGGGGGRVAVYYTSDSGFNLTNNVTTVGGSGPTGSGSAGTVYLQQSGQLGQLLINNGGAKPGALTPLGVATNTVFQVDNLVIVGSNTVAATPSGAPIQANSVTVADGAVLTHLAATTNQTYSLQMTVTNNLVVDAASRINVSGLGYLAGYTQGNTTNHGATFTAGGSYGGEGFLCCGSTTDPVYGDYHNPDDLGSGSGTYGGVPGGGLVRITAGSAEIDGQILANGVNGYDGASGGGIYLNVGALTGGGTINANGGSGDGNDGGGGGRVAVYYTSDSGFNLTNNVTTVGGSGPTGSGSAGTVYLQQAGQLGQLMINNNGPGVGGLTPLGTSTDTVFQVDNLVIVGTNTVVATASGAPIEANSVTVADGAILTHQAATTNQTYSLQMTVTNNLVVDAASRIDVSGLGYLPGYTQGNTTNHGATFTAGGSYGGQGFLCCGSTTDPVYGDYRNPNELGSGSGNYGTGGSGGGLVRITAASAQINGEILANGGNSYDGASGGGIYLNVGALSGGGMINANGGSGDGNDGGGGGRVAVYYTSVRGFNLTNNVTAIGGNGPSGAGSGGTVFLQQAGQLGELLINNFGVPVNGFTPLGTTTDTVFQVDNLVIVGTNTVAATVAGAPIQANSVTILGGGSLTHLAATVENTYSLELTITSNLLIDPTSAINVSGMGYLPGYTQGNTTGGAASFTAGGSYGGLGAVCCGSTANAVYGDYHNPDDLGSGSGTYSGGAAGGGLVRITASSAQVNGAILANGGYSYDGGSGGAILVNVGVLSGNGTIAANGGNAGGNDGGGGGRVAIYAWEAQNMPATNIIANGGTGPSGNGQNGSAYIATTPFFIWGNSPELWHGTEPISWQALGGNPGSQVQVSVTRNGIVYVNTNGSVGPGFINWDTTTVTDGVYVITANFINGSGQAIGQLWQQAAVNNSASYHSGLIATNETWSAGNVNVVDGNVIIPSGVTVTVAPSAVIKVAKGFQIIVQTGGTFDTSGATSAAPIVFTALDDNTVGGDTLEGVANTTPQPGEWSGVVTTGGQFLQNQFVDLRYVLVTLGGTLSANQTLLGTYLYVVSSPVVVPAGVTLTIDPGTVVKFDIGMNITVQTGGNLIARGTVAQPITFTSINDNSVGGDQNGGGTPPAAGDWDSIYISGGTAEFDHVVASYGASQNLPAGLITSTDPASVVSISDSIIQQGLYDGIQDAAGTMTITNCVVTGCDRGIQSGLLGTAQATVVNCTLDKNNYGIFFHGGTASVANTIVANSVQGGIAYCCGSTVTSFEYNDVWAANGINYNNTTWPYPDPTGTDGNISVNPNFVNEANGDYQLNFLSPCIDAADTLVAPPTDIMGDPRYNDPRTPTKTGVPSASGVYADIGAYEFVEDAPSTVDLVPTAVNGPTSVNPGDQVAVTWTVANKGTGPATGPWHDSLSLFSLDGSSNNIAVATELVEQDAILGAGQSYTKSAVVRVPSGAEGNYLWEVHANSGDEIFEGQNITNNVLNADVETSLTLPTLPVGGTLTSTYTATGQGDLYEISPGAAQNLVITLQDNAPGTVLELYLAQGHAPTVSQFDYKSSQFNTNVVSLTVPNTVGGEYYVLAYARSLNSSDVNYTISASVVTQFGVSVVSPGDITDNGPVTLQLNGGQLGGDDTYQLVGPGGTFAATNVVGSNPNDSFVTFNLAGAASGNYSLVITQPNGQSVTNVNAVSVNSTAALPQFSVQLQIPSIYRVGRAFNGLITYGNVGNADMPSPLLILSSGGLAGLQLLPTDSYASNDLVLVAAAMDGPAGVLRAGQTYSIPFSALPYSAVPISFQVDYKAADATDAVDYASLALEVRPPGYSDDDWTVSWNSFQAAAGPTWGGFVQLVDNYATIMAQEPGSGTFYSLQDVLTYAFGDRLEQVETSIAGTLYLGDTNHPLSQTFLEVFDTNNDTGVAQTLVDGTFRFVSLTNGVYTVDVPGYWLPVPLSITVPRKGEVTDVNIIVHQGATIQGVVYDQFGVLFLTNVNVEASSTTTNNVFDTTTGADGSYVLSGLPPDTYALTAGMGSYPFESIAAQSVGDSQTWSTNFFLFNGATVEGQVFANQQPLAGAVAYFTDTNGDLTSTVSDTNGEFDISGLAAGAWTIQVQATGYGPYTVQTNLLAGQTLQLGQISLVPGATIVTILYNTATQIVAQADLSLYQDGNLIGQQYSDSNGVAIFSNLDPGTYQLTGVETGYPNLSNNTSVSQGATVTNIVHLTLLGAITGQVTDASGTPLVGVGVSVVGVGANNQGIVLGVLTDSNGNYTLAGLTAGKYIVTVGNNGGISGQQVTVSSSLPTLTLNFVLQDTVINGEVVNSDGVTPLADAAVLLSQGSNLVATAVSDTNGAYVFRVVLPGTYNLSAGLASTGLTPSQSIVVPANTNLVANKLVIGTVQVGGDVLNLLNAPLAGASVILSQNNSISAPANFVATTGDGGVFNITGLVPGDYVLQVRASGFATVVHAISITVNTSRTFKLPIASQAYGAVTDLTTGETVSNATVSFFDPATKFPVAIISSDAAGNYNLSDLAATNYDAIVDDGVHQVKQLANVSVSSNGLALNVALAKPNTSLSGTITDTGVNPVSGAAINIVDSNTGETLEWMTNASDGVWSTSQLPPGNYAVNIVAIGYLPPSSTNITLAANVPQVVNSIVTAAATDDSSLTGFQWTSQEIGNFLLALFKISLPEPNAIIPAPVSACPCADAAWEEYQKAMNKMDFTFDMWNQAFDNVANIGGASAGVAGAHGLRLLADGIAAFSPLGKAAEVAEKITAMSEAQKTAVFALQGTTLLADQWQGIQTFLIANQHAISDINWLNPTSVQEGFNAIAGSFGDLTAVSAGAHSVTELVDTLKGLESHYVPGSKEDVALDMAVVALDMFAAYNDFKEGIDAVKEAQENYNEAYQDYVHAIHALVVANADCNNCPPPTPPPPPPPPNPTTGTTNTTKPGQANDPNDKLTTGTGASGFVRPGGSILFTVLFENEPTATLPAQEVVITDQLDSRLDYSTVQLGAIGFNNVTISVPPGVQTFSTNVYVTTDPNPVQVNGSLNITNGLLTWVIQSIDPLTGQPTTDPLAGFLPPDNTNGDGEGYVTYSVSSQTNVPNGSIILNQADIVFDANAPILTPVTTNTIDSAPPQSSVTPLPASATNTQFLVQWSGSDYGGSGVASYNVYVSTNNGAFALWLFDTTNTSAIFTGKLFNTYSFYTVAVDDVGNVQATPTAAQASTIVADVITLSASIPNALGVINGEVVVAAGATNTFLATGQDQYDLPLTYQWSFGDGTSTGILTTNSATHDYGDLSGTYLISLTASNGYIAVTKELTVLAAFPLTISKATLDANFAAANADSVSLTAVLDLQGLTTVAQLASMQLVLDIGGAQVSFTLTDKGTATSANGTCKLVYTKATKTVAAYWTLTATLSHGNWHNEWAAYGMVNATIAKPGLTITLPVGVFVGSQAFAAEQPLDYTATANKTGSATRDLTKPTLSIKTPTAGERVETSSFTVTGKAADLVAVESVFYNLNNTDWNLADTTNKWSTWYASVNLTPGANTILAYAVDTSGNISPTNTVKFVYVVSAELTVRTNGGGTIAPHYNDALLQVGASYSMTATPKAGWKFINWTDSVSNVITSSATLKFVMASNLSYVANFLDVAKPTLSITAPPNLQKTTNTQAEFKGVAKDNWDVDAVWYQLNGGAWSKPSTSNGWTNWNVTLPLVLGTNVFSVYAVDYAGNFSITNEVRVISGEAVHVVAFSNLIPLKEEGLEFSLQVPAGVSGHIEFSTDLTSWTTLTDFVSTNSTVIFHDPAASNSSQRFYRAVVP